MLSLAGISKKNIFVSSVCPNEGAFLVRLGSRGDLEWNEFLDGLGLNSKGVKVIFIFLFFASSSSILEWNLLISLSIFCIF